VRADPHAADLRSLIRDIPDFPRPGISFKDITPLMADAPALAAGVAGLAEYARPLRVDCVVAAERGDSCWWPALALELGAGFVLRAQARQAPLRDVSAEYLLEYGAGPARAATPMRWRRASECSCTTTLLATGGTAAALCDLVEQLGGEVVGCGFLMRSPTSADAGGWPRTRSRPVPHLRVLSLRRAHRAPQPQDRQPSAEELWALVSDPTTCRAGGRA